MSGWLILSIALIKSSTAGSVRIASSRQQPFQGILDERNVLLSPSHRPREIDQRAEGDNHDQQGLSDSLGKNSIARFKQCSFPSV
jgi:hypothetical protein